MLIRINMTYTLFLWHLTLCITICGKLLYLSLLHQSSSFYTALGAQWLVIGMKRVKQAIAFHHNLHAWKAMDDCLKVVGGGGSVPAADQTFTTAHLCWPDAGRGCGNSIAVLASATHEAVSSPRRCRRRLVIVVALNGRMLSGQSTDQTMCVLVCWKVWWRPVADWPYIRAVQWWSLR